MRQNQPAQPAPQQRRADPFGQPAAAAAQPQSREVKLVIDDSAVNEAEVGRKTGSRNLIVLGLGAILGLVVGYGGGSTMGDRSTYNQVVRDGKDIYAKVQEASGTIDQANKQVKAALEAATPGPGKAVKVDYEAIEALRALEKPLDASAFARKHYKAFQPNTVDDLFQYNTNTQTLWNKFSALAANTLPESKRKLLDQAAKATDQFAQHQFGMVPAVVNKQFLGGLVYVTIPEQQGEKQEGLPDVQVASRPGGRSVEKTPFQGQPDFAQNPDKYVVLLDKQRSASILAERANDFAEFRAELSEISGMMKQTVEIQGRLLTELGKVAALDEQWTL